MFGIPQPSNMSVNVSSKALVSLAGSVERHEGIPSQGLAEIL